METFLSRQDLDESYDEGELSQAEYDRFLEEIQENCEHINIEQDVLDMGDDGISGYMSYGFYVCSDCGKSSRDWNDLSAD
jgi:hypothetical protein